MLADLNSASRWPIGILGLPVGAYLDLAVAVQRNTPSSIEAAVLPFLVAYSSAVSRASADIFHWRMMAMPFHPAEPDILSVLFCVEDVLRQRERGSLRDLLKTIPLFPNATNILYNAIGERFGDEH